MQKNKFPGLLHAIIASLQRGYTARWADSQNLLFVLTIVVYLATRLGRLDHFPIYFFSDEAVQGVHAYNLINNYFFDQDAGFLPSFFRNVDKYSLGATVYLQAIPILFFGKSVIVMRTFSVLLTLPGLIALCLLFRNIFKLQHWWLAGMLLSVTPAWFLHSRTAFEVVPMVSFYMVALYSYLMYRYGSLKYIYSAIIFGALSFYSYNPGQVVVVVTGLMLLFSDWRYHWQNRQALQKTIYLLLLAALPFIRYLVELPGENVHHLETLFSYWTQPITFNEKLAIYFSNYLFAFDPFYWYSPVTNEIPRHILKGYGHLLAITAPLLLIGLLTVKKKWNTPAYRTTLFALLAGPTGAAMVNITIPRVLVMIIPLTIFTTLGFLSLLNKLQEKGVSPLLLGFVSFALLTGSNIYIYKDALNNGSTWFDDYGLQGMQYGGQQLFTAIEDFEVRNPNTIVQVSPNWANNVDSLAHFFLPDVFRTYITSIDSYIAAYWPIDPDVVFVLMPEELDRVRASQKFKKINIEETLPYPNGQTGFYFVRLQYVDDIETIFAKEQTQRYILQEQDLAVDNETVHIRFNKIDMGQLLDAFDKNPQTFFRGAEANPFNMEINFSTAKSLNGISLRVGAPPQKISIKVFGANDQLLQIYTRNLEAVFKNRDLEIDFGEILQVKKLVLEIERLDLPEPTQVHLWEVQFKTGN